MHRERRAGFVAAFAAAVLLLTTPPAAAADHLAGAGSLQPFFLALSALEQKRSPRPVRIMQIGDSHTANDAFSGRMRERLQARFGAAGRGWLPAGIPFKYYRPALVTVSETGWRHLRPGDGPDSEPLGIDAIAALASDPSAQMTLTSTEAEGFDRLAVEVVTAPHGAPLTVRIDDDSRAAHNDRRAANCVAPVRGVVEAAGASRRVDGADRRRAEGAGLDGRAPPPRNHL